MEIKLILDETEKTIGKQELFDLAAEGAIGPATMISVDGKQVRADRVRGIFFGYSVQETETAPDPPTDDDDDRPPQHPAPKQTWKPVLLLLLGSVVLAGIIGILFALNPKNDLSGRREQALVPVKEHEEVKEPVAEIKPAREQEEAPEPAEKPDQEKEPEPPSPESPKESPRIIAPHLPEDPPRIVAPYLSGDTATGKTDASSIDPARDSFVLTETVESTSEPVAATEARQLFDEAVEQARKPYREELEKELTLARKKGDLNLVLELEMEWKHVLSEKGAILTPFRPEKRTLFNMKVRCKRRLDTALETYRRSLASLIKKLVKEGRTEEAKLVQEMSDHPDIPRVVAAAPKRIPRPPAQTIRLTMEMFADGKGRFIAEKGRTVDLPQNDFNGIPFPFSAFPQAQAFRGENGRGRLLFDMAGTSSEKEWRNHDWLEFFESEYLPSKSMVRSMPGKEWASFLVQKQGLKLPIRITAEHILSRLKGVRGSLLCLSCPDRKETIVNCWCGLESDTVTCGGYYTLPGRKERHELITGRSPERIDVSFQLPEGLELDTMYVKSLFLNLGGDTNRDPDLLESGLSLLDIVADFSGTAGLEVDRQEEKTVINTVSKNGSGERAGLRKGDEVIRFNGAKRSPEQIREILENIHFGDLITVAVDRDGEEKAFRFYAE